MSVCTAHSTAGVTNHDEYAEIGNNNNNTLPDGDIRIRQRMEASRHGMLQLESLRTKHLRLMEQLRNEYPDYTIPTKLQHREKKSPLHAAAIFNTVAAAILSPQEPKFEDASRCESPISSCVSHRSSVSIDSGYTSISSEHQLHLHSHQPPMSYGTYRKLTTHNTQPNSLSDQSDSNNEMPSPTGSFSEQQIVATAIESTTAVKPANRYTKSWQRPKSMYDEVPDSGKLKEIFETKTKTMQNSDQDENLYSSVRPRNQAGKLMDSLSFSQLTPPPMQRKFGNGNAAKNSEKPIPPARKSINKSSSSFTSNHLPQQMPIRAAKVVQAQPQSHVQTQVQKIKATLSQAQAQQSSTLSSPQIRRPLRTAQKPQFATITPQPSIFHASRIYVDRSTSTSTDSSPETPRPRRVFSRQQKPVASVAKVGTYDEDCTTSDYASVTKEEIHLAQPAVVLSRQQSSSYSSESSPVETRKLFVATPPNNSSLFTVYAKPFAERKDACANGKPNGISRLRKEKVWHESEQL